MKKRLSVFVGIMILSSTTWASGVGSLIDSVKRLSSKSKSVTGKTPAYSNMEREGIDEVSRFLNALESEGRVGNAFKARNRMSYLANEEDGQIIHGLTHSPDGTVERFAYHVPETKTSPGNGSLDDDSLKINGNPGIRKTFDRGNDVRTEHYKVEKIGGTDMRVQQDEKIKLEYRLRNRSEPETDYVGEVTKTDRGLRVEVFTKDLGEVTTEIAIPEKAGKVVKFNLVGRGSELRVVVAKDKDTMVEYTYSLNKPAKGERFEAKFQGDRALNPLQIAEGKYEAYSKTYHPYRATSVSGLNEAK